MSVLSQQPRGVFDILTASFQLYLASFTKIIGYALIVALTNRVMSTFVTQIIPVVDPTLSQEAQAEQQAAALLGSLPSLIAVLCFSVLLVCIFYSAMLYRIDNAAHERDDNFIENLLLPVKKLPTLIVAGVLYGIAITIGSFLLVIPGLILMISLAFFWYFILLEDMGAYEALTSSHRLVWGDWWRTNVVFFIPSVILMVLGVSGVYTADPASLADPTSIFNTVSSLLGAVVTPYFYALGYMQYHDLKLRKNM